MGVGSIAELGGKIIDKIWPDKAQADQAKLKLFELQQAGELRQLDADLQLALAQASTNTAEAQSGNAYAAGWRPTVGYVCTAAVAYHFLLRPLCNGLLPAWGVPVTMPPVETGDLLYLLAGMLGIGGMRSFEKTKGVAK